MRVTALKEHTCYCCGRKIDKGENCFAFIVSPADPKKNEFDALYTCVRCAEEEACKIRIKRKGSTSQ